MSFTDGSFPSVSGNAVIFMEPPDTDAQILAGDFDATLTSFAQAAEKHSGTVILPLGEEVNCDNIDPQGGAYSGNTVASTIAAFQHEAKLVRSIDPNIEIAFSANNGSCYGEPSATSFYPGSAYVDIVGDDGFDFGGQTWKQVFDSSLTSLAALGKPMWILSEGAIPTDNQSQFISDTFSGADPNEIVVMLKASDLKRAKAFAAAPKVQEAISKSGVVGKPELHFLKEA